MTQDESLHWFAPFNPTSTPEQKASLNEFLSNKYRAYAVDRYNLTFKPLVGSNDIESLRQFANDWSNADIELNRSFVIAETDDTDDELWLPITDFPLDKANYLNLVAHIQKFEYLRGNY